MRRKEKKEYEKPILVEHENLNEATKALPDSYVI